MDTTTAAAHPHTASEAQVPPPLKALLNILLVVWEVAMKSRLLGFPAHGTVRNVTVLRPGIFPAGVTIWEFEVTGFRDDKGDADARYLKAERASRKLNMCGFFCQFVENTLRRKLQEMELGTLQRLHFHPLPRAIFVPFSSEDELEAHLDIKELERQRDTMHAVLEITTTNGDKLILDGTPDQYDWHERGWIIPKAKAEGELMLGPARWLKPLEEEIEATEAALQDPAHKDFKSLYDRTQELLEGFDWESLMELKEEEMCEEVASVAKSKFKNIFS